MQLDSAHLWDHLNALRQPLGHSHVELADLQRWTKAQCKEDLHEARSPTWHEYHWNCQYDQHDTLEFRVLQKGQFPSHTRDSIYWSNLAMKWKWLRMRALAKTKGYAGPLHHVAAAHFQWWRTCPICVAGTVSSSSRTDCANSAASAGLVSWAHISNRTPKHSAMLRGWSSKQLKKFCTASWLAPQSPEL